MPTHMLRLTESTLAQARKILKGAKIALLGWAFINDSDDARNSPRNRSMRWPVRRGRRCGCNDPRVDPATAPDVPPELSRDLEAVLEGADAVVIFAGHREYGRLVPALVRELCGCEWPVIVDGRNVVESYVWIDSGLAYRDIGRGDKNRLGLIKTTPINS